MIEPRIHEPFLDAIDEKTLVELNFRDNTTTEHRHRDRLSQVIWELADL